MTRAIVAARLRYMPLVLKMATPQQRSWCVLHEAKKEPVTAVQRAFRIQFHMEPPSRVSISEYPFTRITTATAFITRDTLHKVWDELDYCLDTCRVTRGAHIESL
jgi:hypothetical protein